MRARDKCVPRWKADRQVGHPVILAGPVKMIGRAFYSTTASTDDILLWICCQSTSDIHCYRDVKSIPWNIATSVSPAGFSNLPTPPLKFKKCYFSHTVLCSNTCMAISADVMDFKPQCP